MIVTENKMESKLVEAAATGNVDNLRKLMTEDMLLLDNFALVEAQNPLHIASMRGHVSFVQEMLQLKKQFAYELNQDGFTPLHLASACGHLHVVLELLNLDHHLCAIKGREGRVPLHCAVVKGRIDVMKALLSATPLTAETKTVRGDTPLHVAVKNNQFDAVKLLVEHVKEFKMERLLNEQDNQGNTVLHVAASRKQYQVVHLLLVDDDDVKKMIEINWWNERGMTALDVLNLFESEAGDLEIYKTLVKAGAKSGKDIEVNDQVDRSNMGQSLELEIIHHNQVPTTNTSTEQEQSEDLPKKIRYWPQLEEIKEIFGYKHKRDSINDVRNILLTVAALMATATYQAVLSPPGGLWQDNSDGNSAGKSIMATKSEVEFWMFILGNSIGFYTSLHMIIWLTTDFPLQYPLLLLIGSISFNYSSSMTSLVPSGRSYAVTGLAIGFGYLAPFIPSMLRWLRR